MQFFLLSRADVEFSIPLFIYLLRYQPTVTEEMPLVRETLLSILLAYPEKIVEFLGSTIVQEKTELIRVVGELRFEEATPVLLELVVASEDQAEIHLIIKNLGLICDPVLFEIRRRMRARTMRRHIRPG